MAGMAEFAGALVASAVLTWIWHALLRGVGHPIARTITACALALLTATVLAGFGFADGGSPDFGVSFAAYALPQLLVLALLLWRASRSGANENSYAVVDRTSTDVSETRSEMSIPAASPELVDRLTSEAVKAALEADLRFDGAPAFVAEASENDEPFNLAPPPPPKKIGGNPIARHWRGGYSLAVSYWVISFLANAALIAFAAAISAAFTPEEGFEPLQIFLLNLAIWLSVAIVLVWQIVGLWRSAQRHAEERRRAGRGAFWARAAQVMAVIAVLQNIGAYTNTGQPQLTELYRIAFLNDPDIPENQMTLLDGGRELSLIGGIKYGLAHDIETLLNAAPQVTVLQLSSPGGRIAEAQKIFDLVRARGLTTYVSGECSSACTLVFAAGRDRIIAAEGRLGFHGSYFPGMTDADLALANEEWAALYRAAGVDSLFIRRAMSVAPENIWYPTPNELLMAKVVTNVRDPQLEIAPDTTAATPTLAEIESSMRAASGVMDALHLLEPETAGRVYSYVLEASRSGLAPEQMRPEVQRITGEAIARYYPKADDQVLLELSRLLADQLAALLADDPALCFAYAEGGERFTEAYNRLPADLQRQEIAINERVLRSARAREPPTQSRADAIYAELGTAMAKTLTDHQLELIGGDTSSIPPNDYGQYCIAAIVLYREIANLVPSAAGDVLRVIFSK